MNGEHLVSSDFESEGLFKWADCFLVLERNEKYLGVKSSQEKNVQICFWESIFFLDCYIQGLLEKMEVEDNFKDEIAMLNFLQWFLRDFKNGAIPLINFPFFNRDLDVLEGSRKIISYIKQNRRHALKKCLAFWIYNLAVIYGHRILKYGGRAKIEFFSFSWDVEVFRSEISIVEKWFRAEENIFNSIVEDFCSPEGRSSKSPLCWFAVLLLGYLMEEKGVGKKLASEISAEYFNMAGKSYDWQKKTLLAKFFSKSGQSWFSEFVIRTLKDFSEAES